MAKVSGMEKALHGSQQIKRLVSSSARTYSREATGDDQHTTHFGFQSVPKSEKENLGNTLNNSIAALHIKH